jgi:hypothetical protein
MNDFRKRWAAIRSVPSWGAAGSPLSSALDTTLEREVAPKVLRPGRTDDPRTVERFMRKARLAAAKQRAHEQQLREAERAAQRERQRQAMTTETTLTQ